MTRLITTKVPGVSVELLPMRISTTRNATPGSSLPSFESELEQHIWGDLALRLIDPLRLAIIEALYQWNQPLAVADLAAVAGESEDLIRYHCKVLVREGVLQVVEVQPQEGRDGDERFFDFPPHSGSLRPRSPPTRLEPWQKVLFPTNRRRAWAEPCASFA